MTDDMAEEKTMFSKNVQSVLNHTLHQCSNFERDLWAKQRDGTYSTPFVRQMGEMFILVDQMLEVKE